ncbi:hypothetical protein PsorP6_003244 [Peronosclerospora sorghi]|uniref:Uncharacterized protein n=1 Tax=Peronosclerospora sorghi TaxID=230839 RepID=A0ACC0VR18_9STRA|nr:hypothetical protein PsorP6_003244 [Peronosclerospora sorghi]
MIDTTTKQCRCDNNFLSQYNIVEYGTLLTSAPGVLIDGKSNFSRNRKYFSSDLLVSWLLNLLHLYFAS